MTPTGARRYTSDVPENHPHGRMATIVALLDETNLRSSYLISLDDGGGDQTGYFFGTGALAINQRVAVISGPEKFGWTILGGTEDLGESSFGESGVDADDGYWIEFDSTFHPVDGFLLVKKPFVIGRYNAFIRIPDVQLANAEAIIAAALRLVVIAHETGAGTDTTVIAAQDVDDAVAPTSFAEAETAWTGRTSATVAWTMPEGGVHGTSMETADLSTIIQEIVDRPGWSFGNAILLIIHAEGGDWGGYKFHDAVAGHDEPRLLLQGGVAPTLGTHNILSLDHTDVDEDDTPADDEVLTWDNATSKWIAKTKAHTVVSHSDTTGTGAELDELTGGGEITLHSHAGGGGGGGGGGNGVFSKWEPDAPPASPDALDDEFDDASFSGDWTETDFGSRQTVAEDERGVVLTNPSSAGIAGVWKAIPAGDFTIVSKLSLSALPANFAGAGLALWQDATSSSGDIELLRFLYSTNGVRRMLVTRYSQWDTFSATLATTPVVGNFDTHLYLRIRRTGTTISRDHSTDGIGWTRLFSAVPTFTPTHFGLWADGSSGADQNAIFSFFRYKASDVGLGGIMEGDRLFVGAGPETYDIDIVDADVAVTTGNGKRAFTVPSRLDGYDLTNVVASVNDKGVTATTDVMVRRRRGGVDADMLSTPVTLGDEFFAADGVVNATNDDVATGDQIYIDVDAIHSGTAPNGLSVVLEFATP